MSGFIVGRTKRTKWKPWLSVVLIAAGVWQLGGSLWLLAKAELAQYLIDDAWQRQLTTGEIHKPWPWADTWPVARLQLGSDKPLLVLRGTSGEALAFGPGLYETSALPGTGDPAEIQATVIAAHRDTHFRGLQSLQPGMQAQLQGGDGRWHRFRITRTGVVDSRSGVLPEFDTEGGRGLLLVTCYPFDRLTAGGPLRYLVYARYQDSGELVDL